MMSGACGSIMTKEQKSIATQMEKDIIVKLGKKLSPTDKDDKYFNAYVVDLFIGYRRIVPLLKDLKANAPSQ